ncbi:MAG: prenyltransferase/squalene oxidase repeat-containing protein [Planctomycetota bacterium]
MPPRSHAPRLTALATGLALLLATAAAPPAAALDAEHRAKAQAAIDRGIAYLLEQQNPDGSWSPQPGPAITGLALRVLLQQPDIGPDHPAVAKATRYILDRVQPDGSITDGILNNYNTAISLSALALLDGNPEAAEAIKNGQQYLISIQWKEGMTDPKGNPVTKDHPYYGGAGYGGSGRPDMSNTGFMLQALRDTGMDCNDPAFVRAMTFIQRCQGLPTNDLHGDKITHDGGFIYATSINKDHIGVAESKASPDQMDEAKLGKPVSGLRTYGSVTYIGFKSYLYRNLDRDDPLVTATYDWIRSNWTLDRNPGMPPDIDQQGLYYMYMMLGRGLAAFGQTYIDHPDGTRTDWANALIAALAERQSADGSWTNPAERWMEGNPHLVTAYCLTALIEAIQ